MNLVCLGVKQVSSRAFPNRSISTVGVDGVFIEFFFIKTVCDWTQKISMFDDGAIKTEREFEKDIDALATTKKVMQVLRSLVHIKEREYSTSMIDSIAGL